MIKIKKLGQIPYQEGLEQQLALVDRRRSNEIGDCVLLLEHDPVYTIGRTRDRSSLHQPENLPHPLVEISRGGQATFHGPGQLVAYLILDLSQYGRDLHLYLRALEGMLIDTCFELGLSAARRDGLTGVWCGDRKLASIGVGVRHWISLHGFAINVCGDLSPFNEIIPCGITGVEMSSVSQELERSISTDEFADHLVPHLRARLAELARRSCDR
jgi:lipoyl(octanoyl) transferase